MLKKHISILLLLLFISGFSFAQNKYPQDYFIPPLDVNLELSGTFGELRSNHFHSGIDIRTGETEGLEVFAIADAYVSRIKISSGGYGYALYLTHPNGYVSVYGHLQKFNKIIENYTKKQQYKKESFAVDLFLTKDIIKVNKGEIIAWSGNSGSSSGPHLHFEIREGNSQKPVNPLLFAISITDHTLPTINMVKIYPFDNQTLINGKNKSIELYAKRSGKAFVLNNSDTIEISGKAYFGLNTFDPFNGGHNKNGVYSIQLQLDNKIIYSHNLEKFSFAETRYINSLIDYMEYKQKKRRVQKSYIQPNNRLSIYEDVINRGIIAFDDSGFHQIDYIVKDVNGNVAILSFTIKSKLPKKGLIRSDQQISNEKLFTYTGINNFNNNEIQLEIPGNALYDTIHFQYKVLPKIKGSFTPLYQIHYDFIPLHSSGILAIKVDSLENHLRGKTLLAKIDINGNPYSKGGNWDNGFVKATIREFGNYCVMLDTVPPDLSPLNIKNGKNISGQNTIRFRIKDSFSGIKSYRGTLNGQWILMEYDAKRSLLTYRYDDKLLTGKNKFKLTVSDIKDNLSTYTADLIK